MQRNGRILFGLLVAAATAVLPSCSREPMPAVKNAMADAGHSQFYPWESRNLYRRKIVYLDSTVFRKGFSAPPLATGDQAFLVGTNRDLVAALVFDSVAWTFDGARALGDSLPLAPLVADSAGNAYAATARNLYSLDAAGKLRWKVTVRDTVTPGSTAPTPLLAGSTVVVTTDTDLVAYGVADGHERWRVRTGPTLGTAAALGDSSIVVVATGGMFGHEDTVLVVTESGVLDSRVTISGMRITQGPIVAAGKIIVAGTRETTQGRRGSVAVLAGGHLACQVENDVLPIGVAGDRDGNMVVWGPVLRSDIVESRMIEYTPNGGERWQSTVEAIFSPTIALTKKYLYLTVVVPGGRAVYQLTREGKIDETEPLPGAPGSPIVDPLSRVVTTDALGSTLVFLESDIVGKIR